MPIPRRLPLCLRRLVCGLLLTALPLLANDSDWRTFTDTQGRSIRAQLIDATDDEVTIKREDGRTFTLKVDQLSAADQKVIREFAKRPRPIPAGALQVEMSRGMFSSEKKDSDVILTTGKIVKNGRTTTTEKWGYTITLNNKSPEPIKGLRAEYRLFATVDNVHEKGKQGLKKTAYSTKIETIPLHDRVSFRTETIDASKMRYNGNIVSAATGDSTSRETLVGIWIRIYRDQELVMESSMPAGLADKEQW
ncbi:MAG: hypothetical protein ABII82_14625 [Verrucomicrobiota bacterium]